MRKTALILTLLFVPAVFAADGPVDRWAKAIGGREKLAGVKAIYREGTLEWGGFTGTIKVWHTAEGRYRKEEQVGIYSTVDVFDGTNAMAQQGAAPPRALTGPELKVASSKAYANSNALFFVFFPERHHGGRIATEGQDTIVFQPEGGIEWRVALDPETSLPKTIVHDEGGRTITVTFTAWETVDGIKFEKEIRRSAGDPNMGAVIRFTKTVINPPIDPSLFSIQPR